VDWDPVTGLLPDHAPDAVHEVAFDAAQVRVELLPLTKELGLAPRLMVGAGFVTDTVADWVALPPALLHVNTKVASALSAPLDWKPRIAFAPDQEPEAVHEVALVDDQFKVALPPLATELGPTLRVTVGVGALTETVADCVALPPGPEQVSM
jgi:hypothetical protein